MKRVYETYTYDDLRSRSLDHVSTLMNYRNAPRVNDVVASYRNVMGDIFELRFDNDKVRIWTAAGGVSLGTVEFTPETAVEDLVLSVELATRVWSNGYVPCGDCGVLLQRFVSPEQGAILSVPYVALAYHGGRYCSECAPRYEKLARTEVD